MRRCASTGCVLNPLVCLAIERATGGQVTRQDLRPDDYWLIWPDLAAPQEEGAIAKTVEVAS